MERVIYTPPGGPPQGPGPSNEIYGTMGEANIFRMMSDLYKELEKSEVRHLFPANMEEASKKSAAFFVTILGGPRRESHLAISPNRCAPLVGLQRRVRTA